MTTFESEIKYSERSVSQLYEVLTDFGQLEKAIPSGKVSNWSATGDSCQFTVAGLGEIGLKLVSKTPCNEIKYMGVGKVPFNFYLIISLEQVGERTKVVVTAEAKLNALLKMMASKHIKSFIDILSDSIAGY